MEVGGARVPGGRLPAFVYLVVELAEDAPGKDKDKDACHCESGGTPRQPDAEDLVKNAEAYSQDIGPNCVNFTTPNRTLEEFVYSLVVRTTDPEIKGTTLSDLERRPPAGAVYTVTPGVTSRRRRDASAGLVAPDYPASFLQADAHALSARRTETLEVKPLLQSLAADLPAAWKNLYKTVPGRGELTADNSLDWDGTPTFYQAATDRPRPHPLLQAGLEGGRLLARRPALQPAARARAEEADRGLRLGPHANTDGATKPRTPTKP